MESLRRLEVNRDYQPCTFEIHLRGQICVICGQVAAADGEHDKAHKDLDLRHSRTLWRELRFWLLRYLS